MPYTPTTWVGGDIISAERLNKIEQGIQSVSSGGSNTFIVNLYTNVSYDEWYSLDKTLGEIYAAVLSGKCVQILFWDSNNNNVVQVSPVVYIDNVNYLNDTSVAKGVYVRDYYSFYEYDPSAYPVINNYWGG